MTLQEVLKLHAGDEVFWNDPRDGECSRVYQIQSIEVHGAEFLDPQSPDYDPDPDPTDHIVRIEDVDGACLECYADELS
jgi:hypothetical protein